MQPVTCPIRRETDVYLAMKQGGDLTTALGFDDTDRTRIEIVILELTRNILVHAGSGELRLEPVEDGDYRGVAVQARDSGPGIADIALALRDGYSTAHTLGAGLPGVQRLMDDFSIESVLDKGTEVRAIKWLCKRPANGRAGGHRS